MNVEQTLEQRVLKAIDLIKPYLQEDGGDMEFMTSLLTMWCV